MNDFFIASNRTVSTTFLDLPVQIRQIQVKELDVVAVIANPVKTALDNDLSNIDTVLNAELVACLALCSHLSGVPHEILAKAFLEHYDSTKDLIKLVLSVNHAYFIETPDEIRRRKQAENGKKIDSTWFDTFQFLISQGHRHDDIMNMSYGAFKGYLKAAQRSFSNGLITDANVVRMASLADSKKFSKFVDGLKV